MIKGSKHTEEAKQKTSRANKGRKHTEEAKQKMSEVRKGYITSEETKQKMSATKQGIPYDEWVRYTDNGKHRSTCNILKTHAQDLKDDPERLSTEFMQKMIGVKCK